MEHVHGTDIYGIYDLVYEPWWLEMWFLCGVGILVLCVVGGIGYYWYRTRIKTPLSYDQTILKELAVLEADIGVIEPQKLYSHLTTLLKEYMVKRFHVPASGLTDDELAASLKNYSQVPQDVIDKALCILDGVTFIKFAQGAAAQETMEESIASMKHIVESTREQQ